MKKPVAVLAFAALALGGWITVRRPRALRTPTTAQLQGALPGQARTIFEKSETLQLYSLNPSWSFRGQKGAGIFHGYQILGSAPLTPEETRTARRYFHDGLIKENTFSAACFSPRHGLRATQDGRILDLVICFGCAGVKTYIDDKEEEVASTYINRDAQPAFDALLSSHSLPITP